MQGEVTKVEPGATGGVVSYVKSRKTGEERRIESDFIIDCTGLEADISEHRVLNDLLKYTGAGRNPLGRLEVERHFEIKGTANGDGALYASARPRSVATSPAWTRSSGCRSLPRRSPTTWPGAAGATR